MVEAIDTAWTGGCQCGAVRFRVTRLGRASFCHCRMCQKAFGAPGGALVTAHDVVWTRGAPKLYRSSNKVERGFCGDCGTPLTFDYQGSLDIAIAAFDRANDICPSVQLAPESRLAWFDDLHKLPTIPAEEQPAKAIWYAGIVSNQHPDHDTDDWKPAP